MKVQCMILSSVALTSLAVSGCTDRSGPAGGRGAALDHGEQTEPMAPTNRVEIPPAVRSNLGITFAKVERRHVSRTMRVPGRFELLPSARREYRMTMAGHVELLVEQYERVEEGQPLLRFRSPQWTALQGEVIAAEQAVALAEAEGRVAEASVNEVHRRLEILQSRMAALTAAETRRADLEFQHAELEASLERLEAERDLVAARLRAAERSREQKNAQAAAALNVPLGSLVEQDGESPPRHRMVDSITVHAADGGIVESLAITNGAYVDEAALVLTIVDPGRLRFRASILQGEIGRIGDSPPARIVPPQSQDSTPADHVEAEVAFGLEASPQQRTIELIALPHEHHPWMRPGVSAFLEITLDGGDRPELAIPRSALMKDGLQHVFFRRDPRDPNAAIRIDADLAPGMDDGRWVAIRSGLRLGDEVVLDGAYELMLATSQSGGGAKGGHFHPDGTWHADH